MSIKWVPIEQDKEDPNVAAAAWDGGRLFIRFHAREAMFGRQRVYMYDGVAESTFQGLLESDEPDRFHHEHIKPHLYVEVTLMPLDLF